MICDHCFKEFEPRRTGGSPQRFCPGGDCRRAFYGKARPLGALVLRRHSGTAKLTAEERTRRAKDRAADALEAYNKRRAKEIARGAPRLVDLIDRGMTADPDRSTQTVPPIDVEPGAEQSNSEEIVRETDGERQELDHTQNNSNGEPSAVEL